MMTIRAKGGFPEWKGVVMRIFSLNFLVKPLLILAIAVPVASTTAVQNADAHHWRKGAIIAGAIIGGAIVYHNYKHHRKYRRHHRVYYGHPGVYYAPRRVIRYHRHCHRHRGHRRAHCH